MSSYRKSALRPTSSSPTIPQRERAAATGLVAAPASRPLAGLPTQQAPASAALASGALLPPAGDWLQPVLDEMDTGVLVCSPEGRLALANDAGRRVLHRRAPWAMDERGCLQVVGDGARQERWLQALRSAAVGRRRQLLPLTDSDGEVLMVSLVPLQDGPGSGPWSLVLLGRRQALPPLAVQMLGGLYGLTSTEIQVLAGLLGGQRVQVLAAERGVQVSTLRSQVASLRAKMGVRRVDDLVRVLAELPPMMGALRSPPVTPGAVAARADAETTAALAKLAGTAAAAHTGAQGLSRVV